MAQKTLVEEEVGALQEIYRTEFGTAYHGMAEMLPSCPVFANGGKANLIFTSPPFPLVKKKKYGNKTGEEYLEWITTLFQKLTELVVDDGSIVIELGNVWVEGSPEMSTLPMETLLAIKKSCGLTLCQEFIWHNTARLPSPVQWVNIERTRVKDTFSRVWWLSKSTNPKANNRKVLKPYSKSMSSLLKKQKYNAGLRPSEHKIGEKSFLSNHGGAIPPNVIEAPPESLLAISNTYNQPEYQAYCKENNLPLHPARMPYELVEFFIKFLTDEGDLVLDPFGGSNTTGYLAEHLKRRWIVSEAKQEYLLGSKGRFI